MAKWVPQYGTAALRKSYRKHELVGRRSKKRADKKAALKDQQV